MSFFNGTDSLGLWVDGERLDIFIKVYGSLQSNIDIYLLKGIFLY